MPLIELIIFAVLAAVVLYQLYSVLGRRVGRQPEDNLNPAPVRAPGAPDEPPADVRDIPLTGLGAMRARDPGFDTGAFLAGAKQAYEMIVTAFARGDRELLGRLLSPAMLKTFEAAIDEREKEDRTEEVTFLHPPRADLEKIDVKGDTAEAVVRFLAEFRSRTKGPEGEGVDDRRTAEVWTFERDLKSRDPNWTLVHVDAAEA